MSEDDSVTDDVIHYMEEVQTYDGPGAKVVCAGGSPTDGFTGNPRSVKCSDCLQYLFDNEILAPDSEAIKMLAELSAVIITLNTSKDTKSFEPKDRMHLLVGELLKILDEEAADEPRFEFNLKQALKPHTPLHQLWAAMRR